MIGRLYILNAERAREEQRLGLGNKKRGRVVDDDGDDGAPDQAPAPKKASKGTKPAGGQGKLF